MASSQNHRQQERLARQRGAGTHKIVNVGFSIQPLGGHFIAPVVPPPPKAATPTLELSTRISSPNLSQESALVPESLAQGTPHPLLYEENHPLGEDVAHRKLHSKKQIADELAPNMSSSTSTTSAESSTSGLLTTTVATFITREKKTRQLSPDKLLTAPRAVGVTRQLLGRRKNVAADQRQKEKLAVRQRGAGTHKVADIGFSIQSIPGVQLATRSPVEREERNVMVEADKIKVRKVGVEMLEQVQQEVQLELGEEEEQEDEEDGDGEQVEGEVCEQIVEGIEIQDEEPMEELEVVESTTQQVAQEVEGEAEDFIPAIPIKSPENWNKRRKVILGYRKEEVPEKIEEQTSELTQAEKGITTERVLDILRQGRKRQLVDKRPLSPHISIEDDEMIEQEAEQGREEREKEPTEKTFEQQVLEEKDDLDALSHLKPRKRPSTQPEKQSKSKPRRRRALNEDGSSLTFPVLVHRLSKSATHTLPPGSNRSGVNPIDVINQVSIEIVDKYWTKVKSSHERKAVEAFKEELGYRFLELTDVVESNIILATRARQAQKRKVQLMIELLEVKKKRERVAVKMDDVRKVHEMAARSTENQNTISKTFSDITHTLERGKARQPEEGLGGLGGLEALVRKVSGAVTGGGSEGTGLLANVVEFNRFLERAEAVLRDKRY